MNLNDLNQAFISLFNCIYQKSGSVWFFKIDPKVDLCTVQRVGQKAWVLFPRFLFLFLMFSNDFQMILHQLVK